MQILFIIISIIGLVLGIVLIIALIVRHQEVKIIDVEYKAAYERTMQLVRAMNRGEK